MHFPGEQGCLRRSPLDRTGNVTIINSTFSGNEGSQEAGAINSNFAATFNIVSSTITGNRAIRGGGIRISGTTSTVILRNTILAGNSASSIANGFDFLGTLNSEGHNLIQDANGGAITGVTTGNILGADPSLAPLQNYGGPNPTHALLAGSPAIDAGDNIKPPSTDQRGFCRVRDGNADGVGTVDIGAFEFQPPPVLICPANIETNTRPDACFAEVAFNATAAEACPDITVSSQPSSGSFFSVGATTVTVTAIDREGNTNVCTFTVTVFDTVAPVPVVANLPTLTGQCIVAITNEPKAFDNCVGEVLGTTTDPLTYSTPGTNFVTWIYADGHGNSSTQIQMVIVSDTVPPELNLLPVLIGECPVIITERPVAFDSCVGTITATTSDPLIYNDEGTHTVTWAYDDGHGNVATQTQTVVVKDSSPPQPDLASLPVLTGQCSVIVTNVPTATDACSGRVTGTTTNLLTYTNQGTYEITWTYDDGKGNRSTQPQTVIVGDTTGPVINCPGDISLPVDVAAGGVTLDEQALGSVTATDNCPDVRSTRTGIPPAHFFPIGTTTITNTAVDASGNTATCLQLVIIRGTIPPRIVVGPVDQEKVTPGSTVDFSVLAEGTEPLSYQWFLGDAALQGRTNAVLHLSAVTTNDAGIYGVVVSNAVGTNQTNATLSITSSNSLQILVPPASQVVPENGTGVFAVFADGAIPLTYEWLFNGKPIPNDSRNQGASSQRLRLKGVKSEDSGRYTVTVSDASGSNAIASADLIVTNNLVPPVRTFPSAQTVTEGAAVTFTAVSDVAALSYEWLFNGAALPDRPEIQGAKTQTLEIATATTNDTGIYSVRATFPEGASTTSAPLLVLPQDPKIISFPPPALSVPEGTDFSFAVTATGTSPLTYEWRLNDIPLSGATEPIFKLSNVRLENEGVYKAVVTSAKGSVSVPEIVLSVIPATEGTRITRQPASQTARVGDTVTFFVDALGSEPLTFQWRLNRVNLEDRTNALERGELSGAKTRTLTIKNVLPGDGGRYDVVVRNGLGIEESAVAELLIELADGGPFAFSDDFFDPSRIAFTSSHETIRSSNMNATRVLAEPLHAGKFGNHSVWLSWRAPAAGIATFDTQGSSFDTLLAVYTGDRVDTLNDIAEDDDGGGFLTSKVRFNAVPGVEYKIAVDGLGAANGNLVLNWRLEETENVLPTIRTQPRSLTVQIGSSASFTIDAVGNELSYQWKLNGMNISGANAPMFQVPHVSLKDLGSYIVEVTARGGVAIESSPATLQTGRTADVKFQNKIEELFLNDRGLPNPDSLVVLSASALSAQMRVSRPWPIQLEGAPASQPFSDGSGNGGGPGGPAPQAPCDIGGQAKWLLFQATTDSNLFLDTKGSKVPSFLAVFRGTNLADMHLIVCKEAIKTGNTASVGIQVTNRYFYAVVVDAKSSDEGILALNWTLTGPNFRILLLSTKQQVGRLVMDIESNGLRMIHEVFKGTEKISVPFGITSASESGSGLVRFYIDKPKTQYLVVFDTLAPTNDVAKLKVGWDIPLRIRPTMFESVQEISISWEGSGFNVQTAGVVQGAEWNLLGSSNSITITNVSSNAFFRIISDPLTKFELPIGDFFQ